MLSCFQSQNVVDVYPVFLLCWVVPNLEKKCWRLPCQITLQTLSQSFNIAEAYLVLLGCCATPVLKTLLMHNPNCYTAELLPILKLLLTYTLSCYINELVPIWERWQCVPCFFHISQTLKILKHCLGVPWLVTLLSNPPCFNSAETCLVLVHCWDAPNLETLLIYTLSCDIAEMFQFLKHCCCITCFLQCWAVPHLIPLLRHILFFFLTWWVILNPKTMLM